MNEFATLWKKVTRGRTAWIFGNHVLVPVKSQGFDVFDLMSGDPAGQFSVSNANCFSFHHERGLATHVDGVVQLHNLTGNVVAQQRFERRTDVPDWSRDFFVQFSTDGTWLWVADGFADEPCVRLLDGGSLGELDPEQVTIVGLVRSIHKKTRNPRRFSVNRGC